MTGWTAGGDGLVLRSDDSGVGWSRLTEGGPRRSCRHLFLDNSGVGRWARAENSRARVQAESSGCLKPRARLRTAMQLPLSVELPVG
jgi:hypothetical protein